MYALLHVYLCYIFTTAQAALQTLIKIMGKQHKRIEKLSDFFLFGIVRALLQDIGSMAFAATIWYFTKDKIDQEGIIVLIFVVIASLFALALDIYSVVIKHRLNKMQAKKGSLWYPYKD